MFRYVYINNTVHQGYNARKVISEVYASFVLSLGGNGHWIHLSHKNQ